MNTRSRAIIDLSRDKFMTAVKDEMKNLTEGECDYLSGAMEACLSVALRATRADGKLSAMEALEAGCASYVADFKETLVAKLVEAGERSTNSS